MRNISIHSAVLHPNGDIQGRGQQGFLRAIGRLPSLACRVCVFSLMGPDCYPTIRETILPTGRQTFWTSCRKILLSIRPSFKGIFYVTLKTLLTLYCDNDNCLLFHRVVDLGQIALNLEGETSKVKLKINSNKAKVLSLTGHRTRTALASWLSMKLTNLSMLVS